jgi:hypothetical protein
MDRNDHGTRILNHRTIIEGHQGQTTALQSTELKIITILDLAAVAAVAIKDPTEEVIKAAVVAIKDPIEEVIKAAVVAIKVLTEEVAKAAAVVAIKDPTEEVIKVAVVAITTLISIGMDLLSIIKEDQMIEALIGLITPPQTAILDLLDHHHQAFDQMVVVEVVVDSNNALQVDIILIITTIATTRVVGINRVSTRIITIGLHSALVNPLLVQFHGGKRTKCKKSSRQQRRHSTHVKK